MWNNGNSHKLLLGSKLHDSDLLISLQSTYPNSALYLCHSSQLKTTRMLIDNGTDISFVLCSYNAIVYSNKNKLTTATHNNLDIEHILTNILLSQRIQTQKNMWCVTVHIKLENLYSGIDT